MNKTVGLIAIIVLSLHATEDQWESLIAEQQINYCITKMEYCATQRAFNMHNAQKKFDDARHDLIKVLQQRNEVLKSVQRRALPTFSQNIPYCYQEEFYEREEAEFEGHYQYHAEPLDILVAKSWERFDQSLKNYILWSNVCTPCDKEIRRYADLLYAVSKK